MRIANSQNLKGKKDSLEGPLRKRTRPIRIRKAFARNMAKKGKEEKQKSEVREAGGGKADY
jgi:hypothetical protein